MNTGRNVKREMLRLVSQNISGGRVWRPKSLYRIPDYTLALQPA